MMRTFDMSTPGMNFHRALRAAACVVAALGASSFALAADAPSSTAQVDYARDIKPLLKHKCYACHGALKQEGGLRLDTRLSFLRGGDGGAAIAVGKSADSSLLTRLTAAPDERMPPEGEGEALTRAELNLVRAWIDQGAPGPSDEQPEEDPRAHWAFRAPVKPALPVVKDPDWANSPVDKFLAARHERDGLKPVAEAPPALLLRRLYLDLTGLPPTLDELAAFEQAYAATTPENREQAYGDVVDKLLASPHYGERWGRHWMDVWRYSDWWGLGAEVRNSQKHIWHWRDWILESLNADKGYDQMVREMLAADELYPTDPDRLRGTGFLARNYFKFNRTTWLDGVIEHTAKGLLGLTFNCAKCHDHKYDPFSQKDYYQLRAIFEPYQLRTDQVAGQVDFERDGLPRAFDCNVDTPTYLHIRGDDTRPRKDQPLAPGLPGFLSYADMKITPVALPVEAYLPVARAHVLADHLQDAEAKIAAARVKVTEGRAALEKATGDKKAAAEIALAVAEMQLRLAERQPDVLRARAAATHALYQKPSAEDANELAQKASRAEREHALAKAEADAAQAKLEALSAAAAKKADADKKVATAMAAVETARKNVDAPSEKFSPLWGALKTLESNLESEASRSKPFPSTSTGRRTALATWIADRRHPLTARVAVNHIWSRHMGRPLVPQVFDFGRKGQPPTHPELLDYLAVDFMEHGWSMKRLHRQIVLSRAYRLSASSVGADPATLKADPENKQYWRRNSQRMEAQVVRDNLLALSGELDLKFGGPSIPVNDEASKRRSLYFVHSHNEHQKFLALFDDAGVQECYRRSESIVPQQALALSNSKLALAAAEKITARLTNESAGQRTEENDRAFIDRAWRWILCASPSPLERAACLSAMDDWRAIARGPAQNKMPADATSRVRVKLIEALLNHNDFVTIR